MTLIAAALKHMLAAGMPHDAIVAAVAEMEASNASEQLTPRQQRNRRYYEAKASEKRLKASNLDVSDAATPIPDKEVPQTPLENNPYPKNPTPPNGGSPSQAETDAAIQAYSEMAALHGLAVPRGVTGSRRQRVAAVVRAHGLECWREAVTKLGASDFCRGMNDRGWKADLDFLLQAKSFTRVLEGHYDNRQRGSPAFPSKDENIFERAVRELSNGSIRDGGRNAATIDALPRLSDQRGFEQRDDLESLSDSDRGMHAGRAH